MKHFLFFDQISCLYSKLNLYELKYDHIDYLRSTSGYKTSKEKTTSWFFETRIINGEKYDLTKKDLDLEKIYREIESLPSDYPPYTEDRNITIIDDGYFRFNTQFHFI